MDERLRTNCLLPRRGFFKNLRVRNVHALSDMMAHPHTVGKEGMCVLSVVFIASVVSNTVWAVTMVCCQPPGPRCRRRRFESKGLHSVLILPSPGLVHMMASTLKHVEIISTGFTDTYQSLPIRV